MADFRLGWVILPPLLLICGDLLDFVPESSSSHLPYSSSLTAISISFLSPSDVDVVDHSQDLRVFAPAIPFTESS